MNTQHCDEVFQRVMEWGRPLVGFTDKYALAGALTTEYLVNGISDPEGRYIKGVGDGDTEKHGLFAMNMAWTFWLDDHFDRPKSDPLDIRGIIDGIHGAQASPEGKGFASLRVRYESLIPDGLDFLWWLASAQDIVLSWHENELLTRNRRTAQYALYIDGADIETTVRHLFFAASALYGLKLAERVHLQLYHSLIRNVSIQCRLQNDLWTYPKDAAEGVLSNAVRIVERHAPGDSARRFIESEFAAYGTLAARSRAVLGDFEPLARLSAIFPLACERLYQSDVYQGE